MPKLKYDCYLESTAMQHAKKCKFAHSNQKGRIGIGENLCTATFPKINGTKMAQICSKIWFDELKTNGVGEENMLTWTLVKRRGKPIAIIITSNVQLLFFLIQMVWQNTTTIGCAVALCLDSAIAVCHYKPKQVIYFQTFVQVQEP
ncbi:SCP-like protein [Dictyocaulus viviparus]|uniref:SCP-like protein n=1 Tax=Dictyocaulus viviparus TaxID=29172 RepID=A0A0D8XBI7_DICVI|nr:SCP-like protein [Dictyocaulus viviparus]